MNIPARFRFREEIWIHKNCKDGTTEHTKVFPRWYHYIQKIFGKTFTITNYGRNTVAKALFNITPNYPINSIGAIRTVTTTWFTPTITYEATGKIRIHNENNPWTAADTYSVIRTSNSSLDRSTWYHTSENIHVKLTSGEDFWAEILITCSVG
jgi:hypothetical protein